MLEFSCLLFHAAIAHRLVLGGIRLDFGAVKRHMTELYQTRFLTETEHLDKKTGKRFEMTLAKISYGVMIRMLVGSDNAKRYGMIGCFLYLARGSNTHCICIDQQTCHHGRVIRRLPPALGFIGTIDRS